MEASFEFVLALLSIILIFGNINAWSKKFYKITKQQKNNFITKKILQAWESLNFAIHKSLSKYNPKKK